MKVLITGGAGFIGSHLTDRLLETGHRVTAIDDLSTGRLANLAHLEGIERYQFVHETIMHEAVMDRLVSEHDVIYHLASAVGVELIVTHPVEVIERCILGTEIVLRTAHRHKRKVLLTSTSEVYGRTPSALFGGRRSAARARPRRAAGEYSPFSRGAERRGECSAVAMKRMFLASSEGGRMRDMTWLMFLALLFIDGVTQAQSATGSMILAEGFASPNTYSGLAARVLRVVVQGH